MLIIGLTGSIGMGKSTVCGYFRDVGVPVHDSDASVHALYRGAAAPLIGAAFPGSVDQGVVDRAALGRIVLADASALQRLEKIVHPLVFEQRQAFLAAAAKAGYRCVVLDVPLLFETGGHVSVDIAAVVTAPPQIQAARVMQREGMTQARFDAIRMKQMPDEEKRRLAHFIIDSAGSFSETRRQTLDLLRAAAAMDARRSPAHA